MDIGAHEFERNKAKQVMMLARQSERSKTLAAVLALLDAKIAKRKKKWGNIDLVWPRLVELRAEIEGM